MRARRRVEVVQVDETFNLDHEQLANRRVPPNDNDSGRIEHLPDGSISIPIYVEELIVSRRTILKERVIISKEIVTGAQRIEDELRREHVEFETEGTAELYGDIDQP